MATVEEFAHHVREAIATDDVDHLVALFTRLRETNPVAADELAQEAATAYRQRADEAMDAAWGGDECRAWRKRPSVIGGPTHTHVCRLEPGHELPHRCHSADGFEWPQPA